MASFWNYIVVNYSPYSIDLVGTLVVQVLFWWVPSLMYVLLDVVAPSFAAKHKIQPAPKQPTTAEVYHAVTISLRNQLVVLAIHICLIVLSIYQKQPSAFKVTVSLPTPTEFIRDFTVCLVAREILFYYSHRLFHTPSLYRRFHKTHHKFKAPVSFASQYAHPFEHLVTNTLPIALPPAVLGTHILTMWIFLAWQLWETSTVHSGYDFFGGAARRHDRHHERFDVHFGGMPWLDWIHGTDEMRGSSRDKKE
ncbi:Fc.00g105440.m01.CDS01 [Cosmosporella sp. VM-42]